MAPEPSHNIAAPSDRAFAWSRRHALSADQYRRLAQEHQPEVTDANGERVKLAGPPTVTHGSPAAAFWLAKWRQPQPRPTA